jgi:hypothetical protein
MRACTRKIDSMLHHLLYFNISKPNTSASALSTPKIHDNVEVLATVPEGRQSVQCLLCYCCHCSRRVARDTHPVHFNRLPLLVRANHAMRTAARKQ